jgi:hypothetical protein
MTHKPDPVEELVRSAGPRPAAPTERARRVEAAVRLEWQNVVRKRTSRRRAAWIAATCLTSAAAIALVMHAHVPAQTVVAPAAVSRPIHASYDSVPRNSGSYFRANNDDRPADRGMQRHVLASYTTETR